MFVVQFLEGQTIPFGQRYRGGGKQVFSDGPQIPLDPAGRPNIGGIPWTVGQAVLSLSAYAYQKAVSLVLAIEQRARLVGLQHRRLAFLHHIFGAAHRMRRIHRDDMAGHQPVEQYPDRGEMLLHRGR